MPHNTDGSSDPSMLGAARYPRNPLDFYPTEPRCTRAFLDIFGDDIPAMTVWEPFCGNGAIAKVLKDAEARDLVCTDIKAYEGFDPDGLFDFWQFQPQGYEKFETLGDGRLILTLDDLEALGRQRPDAIITNPPYEKGMAERAVRHAIRVMEPEKGFVAMLLRNEFDCSKKRADLFEGHPAYACKISLRFRPRWVEGSKGSPRHNYAWFIWDWSKAAQAPGIRPEMRYAG